MIICTFSQFDFSHRIYQVEEGKEQELIAMAPLENLAETISICCNNKADNHVVLTGSNIYCPVIQQDVYRYAVQKYNNTNLLVEVK